MSGIKTSKETYRTSNMQITFKLLKVKNAYEKVLEEVPCNLQKCQIKSTKKKLQVLKFVTKSLSVENPDHAETSQLTRNAIMATGCNKKQSPKPEEISEQIRVP